MINELIKEAVLEILKGDLTPVKETQANEHPLLGQRVVVRCRNAGVHYGTLVSVGDHIILSDSHRIWSWDGAFTLSEVSQNGIKGGRIACEVETLSIPACDLAEILNLTRRAYDTFSSYIEN